MKRKEFLFFIPLIMILMTEEGLSKVRAKLMFGTAYIIQKKGKRIYKMMLNKKYTLSPGSQIKTLKKSKVIVVLSDGGKLALLSNTLWKVVDKREKEFALTRGVMKVFKKKKGEHKHSLYLPTAVVGVRGTEYTVAVADDGSSIICVDEGEVNVVNPLGAKGTVKAEENVEVSISDASRLKSANVQEGETGYYEWIKGENEWVESSPDEALNTMLTYADGVNQTQPTGEVEKDKTLMGVSLALSDSYRTFASDYRKKLPSRYNSLLKKIEEKAEQLERKYLAIMQKIEKKYDKFDKKWEEKFKE